MKIYQKQFNLSTGWKETNPVGDLSNESLVLAFGSRTILEDENIYNQIKADFPNSKVVLSSTSGEIFGTTVSDETVSITAVDFEKTKLQVERVNIDNYSSSEEAGKELSSRFAFDGLKHVFLLSDGGKVNGTALLNGLKENFGEEISVTGGLAGDAARFEKTLVGFDAPPSSGEIVAVGFYSNDLNIGYASVGGWDSFGPERIITKSDGNILYELDGKSALSLYKEYLGEKAKGLPGSALLFPLNVKIEGVEKPLVRTILSIDEEKDTMVFAGDLPEGATASLMRSNFDKLIDGAGQAAELSLKDHIDFTPELAILVSCVGRKLVLDQRIEEEVEEVAEIIGKKAKITGFYSYGELAPFAGFMACELHNQTMTITLMSEN